MTPRRTMSIAQQLYEGVDIAGEGTVGLITYMRTDSLRLSEEALAAAKTFIESRYGKQYYPAKTRHYKSKGGGREKGLDQRAVPALQAHLEPFSGLPDGVRRVR